MVITPMDITKKKDHHISHHYIVPIQFSFLLFCGMYGLTIQTKFFLWKIYSNTLCICTPNKIKENFTWRTVLFRWKICIKYTLTDCHRASSLPINWSIRWSMTFWPHWKNHFRLNNSRWIVSYYRIWCTCGKRRRSFFFTFNRHTKKKRREIKMKCWVTESILKWNIFSC